MRKRTDHFYPSHAYPLLACADANDSGPKVASQISQASTTHTRSASTSLDKAPEKDSDSMRHRASPPSAQRGVLHAVPTAYLGAVSSPFDGYLDWARDGLGVELCTSLKVQIIGKGENGIVATADIKAGTDGVVVPFRAMLHAESELESQTADESLAVSALKQAAKQITNQDDLLAMRLLYERDVREERSFWANHLQRLPKTLMNSLLHWRAHEITELKGTTVHQFAESWPTSLRKSFAELAGMTVTTPEGTKTSLGEALPWMTFAKYEWAITMVWSRFTEINRHQKKFKVLVPVYDMYVTFAEPCTTLSND